MTNCDVVILTDSRYVNPEATTAYVKNVLTEDRILQKALQEKGLTVLRKNWADSEFDWETTKAVLFRSTWDYFNKFDAFLIWLKKTAAKTQLINSMDTILWNIDKHYLMDLEKHGVRIIPTKYIDAGTIISLFELHELTGWKETVLKPTVGGGGRYTYRLNQKNLSEYEDHFKDLIQQEDFMLQPFQRHIPEKGEWSFMVFGDRYSHAVLKKARPGDFRVQDDFGGTVHDYEPSQNEIDFALAAVAACEPMPAYARVDIILDNEGKPAVSELELIEPELWFRRKPEAADLLAEEVVQRIG